MLCVHKLTFLLHTNQLIVFCVLFLGSSSITYPASSVGCSSERSFNETENIVFDFTAMCLDVSLNDLSTFISERYDIRIPFNFEIRWRTDLFDGPYACSNKVHI